jgi:cell division protein ZapA
MGGSSEQVTRVTIFNRSYDLVGEDVEYIRSLAELLDRRMSEVSESTPTVDSVKIAILAALNIAGDYVSTREKLDRLEKGVTERAERMLVRLRKIGLESP